MVPKEEQLDFEELAHETLEELAELIGVKIPYYPEIYLIDRDTKWESLKLPMKYKSDFERIRKGIWEGMAFSEGNVILQHTHKKNEEATIGEECTHILQLMLNPAYNFRNNFVLNFSQDAVIEMFGYFGNKLVYPRRRGGFYWRSLFPEIATRDEVRGIIGKLKMESKDWRDEIAKHGYRMGQILYERHRDGEIPMSQIRKWFLKPLDTERKVFEMFYKMRYEILV